VANLEVGMPKKSLEAIEEHFSKVSDPRVERTKKHKLMDMIAIAIGIKSWQKTTKKKYLVPTNCFGHADWTVNLTTCAPLWNGRFVQVSQAWWAQK
jgi:hypothetical protein